MKYLKCFSEGFHVFEDVRNDGSKELRLTISGHGIVGNLLTLDLESKLIDPEKLLSILNRYFKHEMSQYRHIRLLFCYSADRGWCRDSFAARFSRLLSNPDQVVVEAYQGIINLRNTNYYAPTNSFEDLSQFDWHASIIRDGEPKRVLSSDYDIDFVHNNLFRPTNPHSETIKTAFWNSVEEFEDTFETCNPVYIIDILSSRVFFCNGRASRNINDFLDRARTS
ncbi:hypothetical protein [Xenorhabdus lircayensis]|uniref:Uncharacterized protein n=1 Tax=Xenorhabdus lircayensis TaxID=2763499 RepID=A0ABS0U8W8_9GAMM|nr:hypothetical protein [Xenorhabdus lircayensis]MBI6550321.1 hypothetical protein [Xenorhabdus lircayensis]